MPVLRSHKHRPPAEDFEEFCGEEMKPFVAMQEMETETPAAETGPPEAPPAAEPARPAGWRRLLRFLSPSRRINKATP